MTRFLNTAFSFHINADCSFVILCSIFYLMFDVKTLTVNVH